MAETSIEWTERTWNPTTGCTKISQGCKFCYAEVMHRRLRAMGQEKYSEPFTVVRTHTVDLDIPRKRKKPTVWFVNSMSDLFHDDVPLEFIQAVFAVMNECHWHTFQVLTKRSKRLAEVSHLLNWTPNIWMGVSVEDERVRDRVDDLRSTGAAIKFLSCEPLIGPLGNLYLGGIDWVIVGGESGRKPRPMEHNWVETIRIQCELLGVDFFFKQWGGTNKKQSGRLLNGQTYDGMPKQLSQPNPVK